MNRLLPPALECQYQMMRRKVYETLPISSHFQQHQPYSSERTSYRVTRILVSKSRVLMDFVTSTLPIYLGNRKKTL